MTSWIYNFDLFGHRPKLKVDRNTRTYRTDFGHCMSLCYLLIATIVVIACVFPAIQDWVEGDNDDVRTLRRNLAELPSRRNLAELPSSSVFT